MQENRELVDPGFGDSDLPSEPHTADMLADLVASGLEDQTR
jgi:hypothetical protein